MVLAQGGFRPRASVSDWRSVGRAGHRQTPWRRVQYDRPDQGRLVHSPRSSVAVDVSPTIQLLPGARHHALPV
jgi:hypothetical protein